MTFYYPDALRCLRDLMDFGVGEKLIIPEDWGYDSGEQLRLFEILEEYEDHGFVTMSGLTLDYQHGHYEDQFFKRYVTLVNKKKFWEAMRFAEKMEFTVLNKALQGELTLENVNDLLEKHNIEPEVTFAVDLIENLRRTISIDEQQLREMQKEYRDYLSAFQNDELEAVEGEYPNQKRRPQKIRYRKQRIEFLTGLAKLIETRPLKDLQFSSTDIWDGKTHEDYDFLETLLSLEQEGFLKLKTWGYRADVDEKKIRQELRKLKKEGWINETHVKEAKPSQPQQNHLVTRDDNGEFYYDGKHIELPLSALYRRMFEILFTRCDQDGFLAYEGFEKEFMNGFPLIPESNNEKSRNKKINNAFSKHNGFFRYAEVNGTRLQNKTPNGKKLIEIVRGEGVRLNNPPV